MDENFLKEQIEMTQRLQKEAYEAGWKAGFRAREEELLKMGMIDEARLRQIEKEDAYNINLPQE